jgi:uncharacterized protein
MRFPNVYADTSGVRRFDYIVQAVERAGAHKVLFGSDRPWLHPEVELHKIRVLGLSPEKEALILGKNIMRLLNKIRIPQNIRAKALNASLPRQHEVAVERETEPAHDYEL